MIPATTRPRLADLIPLVTAAVDSPRTKTIYARELAAYLDWHAAAGMPFDRPAVMAYRAAMQEAKRSAASINQALSAIRKLATEAAANRWMDRTLADSIASVPNLKATGKRVGRWLTKAEARRVLALPDTGTNRGARDLAILSLALEAGLRRSEIAELTLGDIEMRSGRPVIANLIGKGGKVRTVPINRRTHAALMAWAERAGVKDANGPLIRSVYNPDVIRDAPLSGSAVYHIIARYAEAAGLEFAPHDLRRTYGRLAKAGGADLQQIQASYGHSSIKTTEIYLGLQQDFEDSPADRLGL